MRRVVISKETLEELRRHSCEESPTEACGLLLGEKGESAFIVKRSFRARNLRESTSAYEVDPRDVYLALKEAEASNLELIGVYHSHPYGELNPSTLDVERAIPGLLYLIVSCDGSFKAFEFIGRDLLELKCSLE